MTVVSLFVDVSCTADDGRVSVLSRCRATLCRVSKSSVMVIHCRVEKETHSSIFIAKTS